MDVFSPEFITRNVINHLAVYYSVNEDSKTESIMIRFIPDHQDGKESVSENFFLSRDVPFGENWMSILDLLDKNDRITDDNLNEFHAAVALLELPDQPDSSSLQDYFQSHTEQFVTDTAHRILTIAGNLLPERPALCVLYPTVAILLADLLSISRGDSTNLFPDQIRSDIESVRRAFHSAETELEEARNYVRNVLILPYTEGVHFPPRLIADHYRSFCQAAKAVDFFGKYSNAPGVMGGLHTNADGETISKEWKAYMHTIQDSKENEVRLTSLAQFIHIGIQDLFDRDHELRTCELCGNYFDTKYSSNKLCCTRLYKNSGMTCTQYSSHYKFRIQTRKENTIAQEYTRAYNQLYARIRTGKTPAGTSYASALKKLYEEYRDRYNACTDDSDKEKILQDYKKANRDLLAREMEERKNRTS